MSFSKAVIKAFLSQRTRGQTLVSVKFKCKLKIIENYKDFTCICPNAFLINKKRINVTGRPKLKT